MNKRVWVNPAMRNQAKELRDELKAQGKPHDNHTIADILYSRGLMSKAELERAHENIDKNEHTKHKFDDDMLRSPDGPEEKTKAIPDDPPKFDDDDTEIPEWLKKVGKYMQYMTFKYGQRVKFNDMIAAYKQLEIETKHDDEITQEQLDKLLDGLDAKPNSNPSNQEDSSAKAFSALPQNSSNEKSRVL